MLLKYSQRISIHDKQEADDICERSETINRDLLAHCINNVRPQKQKQKSHY